MKSRYPGLKIINGGVSGDTAADGLARLDWALTDDVGGLIVELGANDALRGLDVAQTETALNGIMVKAQLRNLPVLILGMKAPPNMGPDYVARFDGLYPRLAEKYQALLYPFYLDGVAANASLNQADGIHPNGQGVDVIVSKVMPNVEELIGKVSRKIALGKSSNHVSLCPKRSESPLISEGCPPCQDCLPALKFPPMFPLILKS